MRLIAKYLTIIMVVSFYAACSPVMFDKEVDCGPGCVRGEGVKEISYTVTVTGGKVDILFVDDNSGSMSFEQKHIADRFSNFISSLDSQGLDYRIAITTTDVETASNPPRTINQNGALQNGRLIRFSDGSYFLTPSSGNKQALFAEKIKRSETLTCETYLRQNSTSQNSAAYNQNCPSADERGIYAASMTVEANASSLIRGDAHLAIVFLSDEDVRSSLYELPSYKFANRDLPQNLISTVQSRFPGKSLSMHSIIVRPGQITGSQSAADVAVKVAQIVGSTNQVNDANRPERFFTGGDSSCLAAQSTQIVTPNGTSVTGSYGYMYYLAAKMTGGVIGDICSNDYSGQLQDIGENIGGKTKSIALACENPKILDLRYVGDSGTPPGQVEGSSFVFGDAVPVGKTIFLKIECPDA